MQCGSYVLLCLSLHEGYRLLRGEDFLFNVKKRSSSQFYKLSNLGLSQKVVSAFRIWKNQKSFTLKTEDLK